MITHSFEQTPSFGISASATQAPRLLDPGFNLTLRPMRYPQFYDMYRDAIRNTWTVEEVDFSLDVNDLRNKFGPAERHLIERLVAFFATGDSIVANNLVLNLYKHINAPEARMYLSRQLYEEALHVQFYLTLLDTYLPEPEARAKAFDAIENIPAIRYKADFCFKWMDSIGKLDRIETREQRRQFLLNLICFAACIEGLFFFAAFAYVYYLRSRGLLHGLAAGTNWVFRDESGHMAFAFEVIRVARDRPISGRCSTRPSPASSISPKTCCRVAWPDFRCATCASISNTSRTSDSRSSACRSAITRGTRSRSWTCRTCRN
jgi:ribonucleoside-diphosphate reductase beta chain